MDKTLFNQIPSFFFFNQLEFVLSVRKFMLTDKTLLGIHMRQHIWLHMLYFRQTQTLLHSSLSSVNTVVTCVIDSKVALSRLRVKKQRLSIAFHHFPTNSKRPRSLEYFSMSFYLTYLFLVNLFLDKYKVLMSMVNEYVYQTLKNHSIIPFS